MSTATPKNGTVTPPGIPGMSAAADCDRCGRRIRLVRKAGREWWIHIASNDAACRIAATPPSASPATPATATPPEPKRDSLGFPIEGAYARPAWLREGGWTGGVDRDGRPTGPILGVRSTAAWRHAELRMRGYHGELGPDGYPAATSPTGDQQQWLRQVGPVEVGGVYTQGGEAWRVLAIELTPDGGVLWVEDSEGLIYPPITDWHNPGRNNFGVLFSPSHPDDAYAYELEWLRQQHDRIRADADAAHAVGDVDAAFDLVQELFVLDAREEVVRLKQATHLYSEPPGWARVTDRFPDATLHGDGAHSIDQAKTYLAELGAPDHVLQHLLGDRGDSIPVEAFADLAWWVGAQYGTAAQGSGLDPQTPADRPVSGSTTGKETNAMSTGTDTGEATSHETAQAVLGALRARIATAKQGTELTVNNLQAAGIGGDTIDALYTVMDALNSAETSAKTAEDTYNRTQAPLAEAATAAGDNAASATAYYTG